MPLDIGIVILVGAAVKLSWSIYEKRFTKEKSLRSSPYLPTSSSANPMNLAQRYREFGDALFRLHSNLNTI
jgi:hypothetical protein